MKEDKLKNNTKKDHLDSLTYPQQLNVGICVFDEIEIISNTTVKKANGKKAIIEAISLNNMLLVYSECGETFWLDVANIENRINFIQRHPATWLTKIDLGFETVVEKLL